jgi:hypothetical protein
LNSPSDFLEVPFGLSRYHMFRSELELAQCFAEDLLRLSRGRHDTEGSFSVTCHPAGICFLPAGLFLPGRIWKQGFRFTIQSPTNSQRSQLPSGGHYRGSWGLPSSVSASLTKR